MAGGWAVSGTGGFSHAAGGLPRAGSHRPGMFGNASPALTVNLTPARKAWKAARPAGSAAAVRVGFGCDHAGGSIVDGGRKPPGKPLPGGQYMPGSRAGAPPIMTAWPVGGPPGTDVGGAPGGHSRVGRQVLLGRCFDRPCLDAASSLEEVNGQGLAIAVVPEAGLGSSDWLIRLPGPGTASVAGVVVGDPGRLQLDHSPGGVVHLRYRQAEPVPQAPEPFAAGPGDRLLQLLPVRRSAGPGAGLAMAVSGAGRPPGCSSGMGRFRGIVVSLVAWPGFAGPSGCCRKLMSSAMLGSRLASLSRAAEVLTTQNRPQEGPQDSPQESARLTFPQMAARGRRGPWRAIPGASAAGSGRASSAPATEAADGG